MNRYAEAIRKPLTTGWQFYVTPISRGIRGYVESEIAPMFAEAVALENVNLPAAFREILKNELIY